MRTKIHVIVLFTLIATLSACGQGAGTGKTEPWTANQLLAPAELAKTINNPDAPQPYVFCIGPQAVIKNSIDIGSTGNPQNLAELGKQIDKLPKDADIVIYCGCCPFSRCPNVRPAFEMLNKKQFTNHKLLNLPQNVKVDWIDHGYPVMY